jgi:hypothetical protein
VLKKKKNAVLISAKTARKQNKEAAALQFVSSI